MLIGVIADDFTGASDIGVTLAGGLPEEGGLKTALYMGVPDAPAEKAIGAGVIALKSRSWPVDQAIEQSLLACDWLLAQGCRQIVFKYCSTFDSTDQGNIGPVAEALAEKLSARGVVVCPSFPAMKRTLYQGHLFVNDQLLNESGMENHPLTPMTDADLRRVLASQSTLPQGFIHWQQVQQGSETIRTLLQQQAEQQKCLVLVDAISDDDLLSIAKACHDAPLLTGGSAIARGLPHNFISRGEARGEKPESFSVQGQGAILVGSCSRMTLRQIEYHRQRYAVLPLDVEQIIRGEAGYDELLQFVEDHQQQLPLIYTSGDAARVRELQQQYGREEVSQAIEQFFAGLAPLLTGAGVRRLVVGGGETSGAVVTGLGIRSVVIGAELSTGVPALLARDQQGPLGLALKSGNFGEEDFFSRALTRLGE